MHPNATPYGTSQTVLQNEWVHRLAIYAQLRVASDAMPLETPGEDEAVDDYCVAMDRLIKDTPAPSLSAILVKLDLARIRGDGVLFEDFGDAIRADIARLAMEGR